MSEPIINPEWEKLGSSADIDFPCCASDAYKEINVGPPPKCLQVRPELLSMLRNYRTQIGTKANAYSDSELLAVIDYWSCMETNEGQEYAVQEDVECGIRR